VTGGEGKEGKGPIRKGTSDWHAVEKGRHSFNEDSLVPRRTRLPLRRKEGRVWEGREGQ